MIAHPWFDWLQTDLRDSVDVVSLSNGANCTEFPWEMFFLPDGEIPGGLESIFEVSAADYTNVLYSELRSICVSCPRLAECFSHAIKHEEYGFYGGTSPAERETLRKKHGIRLSSLFDSDKFDETIINIRHSLDKEVLDNDNDSWEDVELPDKDYPLG